MRSLVQAVCLLVAYGPYLWLLRLLGPRPAVLLARGTAWLHWLLTFVGAQGRTRRVLRQILPGVRPDLRPRAVLRDFLIVQHQHFAERGVAGTARGRRYLAETYDFEGKEHLDAAVREGRGVILLIFHFGMARLLFPALNGLGYETFPNLFRGQRHAESTFGWVARRVRDAIARTDEGLGKFIYLSPNVTFPVLVRHLRRGTLLGINGDGFISSIFLDVPFLGGTLLLPPGPALLSAHARAPIVPVYALLDGVYRHRMVAHPPMYCPDTTPEAVEKTVRSYTALLEDYVRRYPAQWWTWRNLLVERDADGRLRLRGKNVYAAAGSYLTSGAGAAG